MLALVWLNVWQTSKVVWWKEACCMTRASSWWYWDSPLVLADWQGFMVLYGRKRFALLSRLQPWAERAWWVLGKPAPFMYLAKIYSVANKQQKSNVGKWSDNQQTIINYRIDDGIKLSYPPTQTPSILQTWVWRTWGPALPCTFWVPVPWQLTERCPCILPWPSRFSVFLLTWFMMRYTCLLPNLEHWRSRANSSYKQ